MFLRRMLMVAVPLALLTVGAALHAAPNRPRPCGPPKGFAAFLQKVGLTSGKYQACEVTVPDTVVAGSWCVNAGHHCNDGSGPGRCASVWLPDDSKWVCTCQSNK